MTSCYSYKKGSSPLLVSVPHDGRLLPTAIESRMTAAGLALPDTDWHVARLYEFVEDLGASLIVASYSRYVVDLNRSSGDEALYENRVSTGLCPVTTFAGAQIYLADAEVTAAEQALRVEGYWRPYHSRLRESLNQIKAEFGYALLWDAHSIRGVVPLLFDGELPDLNTGTNGGASCPASIASAVADAAERSSYSSILNGRFRGGHITREYGTPAQNICAIQLELAQRCYMDEMNLQYDAGRAELLAGTIAEMMSAYLARAKEEFGY